MDHHRQVEPVEDAVLQHDDLAASPLFGRGPQYPNGDPGLVGDTSQTDTGADAGGGDDVVPAGVADPRERIEFGTDPDHQRSTAVFGDERRVEAGNTGGHVEAGIAQRLDAHLCSMLLFERKFRVLPEFV